MRPPVDRSRDPLLSVHDLAVHLPGRRGFLGRAREVVRAVAEVSFDVWPGETLGLVGESGCGKTTTGRALVRLVEAARGSITFDGQDVRAMDKEELKAFRRRVQFVFQDPFGSLNPRMTVGAMLGEALSVHGLGGPDPAARVVDLLERVGLGGDHVNRYPHEFSGGQRQRLGIARALSVEPELLILDEPVSALDVSVRAQVINLLEDLQIDLGLTYVFIAHDLSLVEHVSDRVAVMYAGRIVELAEASALYAEPRHPYTRALLSAVPRPDPSWRKSHQRIVLEGEVPSPVAPPSGCPFHTRCPHPGKDTVCRTYVPPLEEDRDGHLVACHKVGSASETGVDTLSGADHNPTLP